MFSNGDRGPGDRRPGDWTCGNCRFSNFAQRRECFRCNITRSDRSSVKPSYGSRRGRCRGGRGGGSQCSRTPAARDRAFRSDGANTSRFRESRSIHDLSSRNNTEDRASCQKSRRKYPIGKEALQSMLDDYPEQIVMKLLVENSGYDLVLDKPDSISAEKMCLVMQVLAKAVGTRSNKENLNNLFTKTFVPKFINHLIMLSMKLSLDTDKRDNMYNYFDNLAKVSDSYAHTMPSHAMNNLPELLLSSALLLKQQSRAELSEKYESINVYLESEKKNWQRSDKGGERKQRGRWEDDLQPPNNFRELSIIPTAEEMSDVGKPFLRRNIVHGKYDDVEHYLDVQFRLLREDFLRPLRNGLQEFRSNVRARSRDLYIYKDVKIVGTDVKNFNLIHNVKLELPKTFKAENSKRLMFGNLVCFSCDDFKTVYFGSIAERDSSMLKEGLLGVSFDSEIKPANEEVFVMAESRSYFKAYKHVLGALQKITKDTFPLEEFIVHVDTQMIFPDYLDLRYHYDMQVMHSKNMMKESEIYSELFPQKRKPSEGRQVSVPALQRVFVTRELEYWPSSDIFGVDDSQRQALRNALTSKLSIIQGPPGTGKTYIGLKIAQVLLHNSKYWKTEDKKSPILVVCFTNHALDQFLEGMTPFTNNIVRIGSRTKSEIISNFQINYLVRNLSSRGAMPAEIHKLNNEVKMNLKTQEVKVKSWRLALHELRDPMGIIKQESLLDNNVLPDHIAYQFQTKRINLVDYLLDPKFIHIVKNKSHETHSDTVACKKKEAAHKDFKADEDIWYDAEELYAVEEAARKLDEDGLQDGLSSSTTPRDILKYDVLLKKSEKDLDIIRESKSVAKNVNEVLECERKIHELEDKVMLLKFGLGTSFVADTAKQLERCDLTMLDIESRWKLYKLWLHRMAEKVAQKLLKIEHVYERNANALREIKEQQYLHVMRHASVVGMTTTGAAEYSSVLQSLQSSIVIIEEAAEILEAHVITSLTESCQHLIMIGDHQQLQPSTTVYELATKFGLQTSLFERLIQNNVGFVTLEYQHRMRTNISRLLVPSIYPRLKDHESVYQYPHVKGMQRDVFFITHEHYEDKGDDDNSSKENTHEAVLIMALCRHLMLQGYSNKELTVLTPYSGQFFLLKKVQRQYEECQGVRISVVDNFQGEENKIILLSLVRSNEAGKVGFLSIENRICVALSRAKHGLYIAGNMKQLQQFKLWKEIKSSLVAEEAIGERIGLQCENHPEVLNFVMTGKDILAKSPEGGCTKPFSQFLPKCGHKCPKICHIVDSAHMNIKCPVPCPKIICERSHSCPQKCWEECNPCEVLIPKTLPCEHVHNVKCCNYHDNVDCPTLVTRVLPDCQHTAEMMCSKDPNTFPCPVPCEIRLPCGHRCYNKCHVKDDPDHINYTCEQPCPRSPDGCSEQHKCEKLCYEDCGPCIVLRKKKADCGHSHEVQCSTPKEKIVCNKKCKRMLPCGHHCPRKCKDPCGGCMIKVKKTTVDCGHEIEIECSKDATRQYCKKECSLRLSCGHRCQARCQDPCTTKCETLVSSINTCPKGHSIKVPCHHSEVSGSAAWMYCSEPCGAKLDCDHDCKGKCGLCLHGRLHVACGEKCGRSLVCGHVCKADCSSACPPCQDKCPMRCEHSRCGKKCGEPCNPCKEKCRRGCIHTRCNNLCGEKCTQNICEKPCPETLKCGHPCVGYCGDPCPPLCRICDKEELTQIFFGDEDEDDARFVLLEDCGHVIEANGLQTWLSQESEKIGMKFCPHCKKPIYNNRRNHEFIVKAYESVMGVKKQYYTKKPKQQVQEITKLLADMCTLGGEEVDQIKRSLPAYTSRSVQQLHNLISDSESNLYSFQVQVLKKINSLVDDKQRQIAVLTPFITFVKRRVMMQKLRISPQMVEEITSELQRLQILPPYLKLVEKANINRLNLNLLRIKNKLTILMDPTVKFDSKQEEKVKDLLKESEKYVGGLGITNEERLEIINVMGLRQGHWYKCPNGHIYCITECGRAMIESTCPECGAKIGGGSHTLRSDNALATEMDGALHPA